MTYPVALGGLPFLAMSSRIMVVLAGGKDFRIRAIGLSSFVLWVAWWVSLAPSSSHEGSQHRIRLLGVLALLAFILVAPWEHRCLPGPRRRDGLLA
jgi:hypothetical protein